MKIPEAVSANSDVCQYSQKLVILSHYIYQIYIVLSCLFIVLSSCISCAICCLPYCVMSFSFDSQAADSRGQFCDRWKLESKLASSDWNCRLCVGRHWIFVWGGGGGGGGGGSSFERAM